MWFEGAMDFTIGKASGQLSLYSKGLAKASPVLLSKIRVVAEVPSIEMEVINERRVTGMVSRREKRVVFHDCTQSIDPSLFLDNK